MATVSITLTDNDQRAVDVKIEGLPDQGKTASKAQAFGEALRDTIGSLSPCVSGMGENVCPYCDGTCTKRNGP